MKDGGKIKGKERIKVDGGDEVIIDGRGQKFEKGDGD